ncbi:EF-hand calcium-binding domain-containing protein 12 isoform X2 [Physeter macrocephalus]|uniref:EF-hand calcium-binding domain-containing protein 12 isoform X2 n=1 Tax=Physeter macrocephalus TaxID=9755 RepID=A0A9W2W804_PHYMC|nr:EF-hand calcium-binding domain-containing protein 12 isoform X2 [Physeter catodon]XP_054935366.1 EF-hand calcium-binding domain-containing protein 12 isoform X2 [Physeter catodon]
MDYPSEAYEAVFPSLLRFYQSKSLVDDESASKELVFNPEAVIARCFKQFKQEDFHPPQSPRRIIILPRKEALVPVNPTPQPQAPPEPTPSSKALEAGDIQEQPEDPRAWLTQRLRVRQDLESPGNIERWLQNKSRLTPSEAKVLHESHKEHEARLMGQLATTRDTKKKSLRPLHRQVPQLQLPKPSALSALYSYLCSHKIKIQEIFHKVEQGKNQRISREEFITALKVVGVPLKSQEVEDIVIYLSSLGKHNSITVDNLASICKQWSLAQQKSTLATAKESTYPPPPPCLHFCILGASVMEAALAHLSVFSTSVLLLQVCQGQWFPTESIREAAGEFSSRASQDGPADRARGQHRDGGTAHDPGGDGGCGQALPIPSIQYTEQCRLVHSGNKHFDERCLPSTSHGEMQAVPNRHLSGLPAVLEALQILQPPADRGHPRESPDVPGGQDHFPEGPGTC